MVNDSYIRFDDNKTKYTFSKSSQKIWVRWKQTTPYIEWKIIARIWLSQRVGYGKYFFLNILPFIGTHRLFD